MRSLRRLLTVSFVAFTACGPSMEEAVAPPAPSSPSTLTPVASVAATPAVASAQPAYAGHGAESVSKEVLAQYAPTPLPDDVTAHIQAMLDVRSPAPGVVSEDGKHLFFTWTVTGTRQVFRLDGANTFPRQMTGGEDATTVNAVLPNGRQIVVTRDRRGEEYPGLYLQNAEGGPLIKIQHLPKVRTDFDAVSDDGRYIYFHANDEKSDAYVIYRVDLSTDVTKKERLFAEPGLWNVSDVRGDKLLLAKNVGSNMAEYFEYDLAKKALSPLFGQDEREDYVARYGKKDGEVLVLTPHFSEFRRLYSWVGGKFSAITPEISFDVSGYGGDDGFSIDVKRTRILYQTNEAGYTRLHALDATTYKPIDLPKLVAADHVMAGGTTKSGRYTVVSLDPGNAPMQSFVYDWQSKKLVAWHEPSAPEVDTSRFARSTLESYVARDGTKIPMFVRRPEHCDGPCPVIVAFHGGPEGQALPGFNARAQLFVDAGYVLVEPNVRGSDGYGKTWLHADDGAKRLAIITDIEDAAKHVRKAFAKDGKAPRIAIYGGSYGGYSALVGMTMFAGSYDVGVSVVGISNLVTFLENTAPYRRALRTSEYGDPEKDRDALVKLSPTTYVDRVNAPLFILQGATDPRVPAGEAIQIYDSLAKRSVPASLMIFADEGHGVRKRENQVLLYGHVLRFLEQHLRK